MTVSNIQLRVNVAQGLFGMSGVTGKNIIYDTTRPDGSVDRIERIWHVYGELQEVDQRPGKMGSVIEAPNPELVPELQAYAAQCEAGLGTKQGFLEWLDVNTHLGGAILSKVQIKGPSPKPQYITVPQVMNATKLLEGQVKELNDKVDELTKKLAAETAQKEAIRKELDITKVKLETIESFLKQALSVYTQAK